MFYVLSEPRYDTSHWHASIVNSLKQKKSKDRFSLTFLLDPSYLSSSSIHDDDVLLLLGNDHQWIAQTVLLAEPWFDNRIIVLGTHQRSPFGQRYSMVASDISHSIRTLYHHLGGDSATIALYGINPDSGADLFKRECFLQCCSDPSDLFYNNTSLKQCYDDFAKAQSRFDGVLCVNAYAAVSLRNHLGENHPLPIAAYGASPFLNDTSSAISYMAPRYTEWGTAAVELSKLLIKNPNLNAVDLYLKDEFFPCEGSVITEEISGLTAQNFITQKDHFYADPEIQEMIALDNMLSACKKDDFLLLQMLQKGNSYPAIAESLNFSVNGIKYRLHKLQQYCQVSSRRELLQLLLKYRILT